MLPYTVSIHSEDLPIGQVCGYDGGKEWTNPTPGEIERKKGEYHFDYPAQWFLVFDKLIDP